jgi:hypothetical protein
VDLTADSIVQAPWGDQGFLLISSIFWMILIRFLFSAGHLVVLE